MLDFDGQIEINEHTARALLRIRLAEENVVDADIAVKYVSVPQAPMCYMRHFVNTLIADSAPGVNKHAPVTASRTAVRSCRRLVNR